MLKVSSDTALINIKAHITLESSTSSALNLNRSWRKMVHSCCPLKPEWTNMDAPLIMFGPVFAQLPKLQYITPEPYRDFWLWSCANIGTKVWFFNITHHNFQKLILNKIPWGSEGTMCRKEWIRGRYGSIKFWKAMHFSKLGDLSEVLPAVVVHACCV